MIAVTSGVGEGWVARRPAPQLGEELHPASVPGRGSRRSPRRRTGEICIQMARNGPNPDPDGRPRADSSRPVWDPDLRSRSAPGPAPAPPRRIVISRGSRTFGRIGTSRSSQGAPTRQRLGGICTQRTPGRQERIGDSNRRQILPNPSRRPGAPACRPASRLPLRRAAPPTNRRAACGRGRRDPAPAGLRRADRLRPAGLRRSRRDRRAGSGAAGGDRLRRIGVLRRHALAVPARATRPGLRPVRSGQGPRGARHRRQRHRHLRRDLDDERLPGGQGRPRGQGGGRLRGLRHLRLLRPGEAGLRRRPRHPHHPELPPAPRHRRVPLGGGGRVGRRRRLRPADGSRPVEVLLGPRMAGQPEGRVGPRQPAPADPRPARDRHRTRRSQHPERTGTKRTSGRPKGDCPLSCRLRWYRRASCAGGGTQDRAGVGRGGGRYRRWWSWSRHRVSSPGPSRSTGSSIRTSPTPPGLRPG